VKSARLEAAFRAAAPGAAGTSAHGLSGVKLLSSKEDWLGVWNDCPNWLIRVA
jgi:hypothetical protein